MSTGTRLGQGAQAIDRATERAIDRAIDRRTLSIEEAGRVLGVGRGLAYEAARRGQIPTIRLGHRLVVPVAALERLLGVVGADSASSHAADPDVAA